MYPRIKSCLAMSHLKYSFAVVLLLAGCAQTGQVALPVHPPEQAKQADVSEPVVASVENIKLPEVKLPEVKLPGIELTNELLYQYLLSEFANQRGFKALAVDVSSELAQQTRDPRLAKRAAQLALESGDMNKTVAAFRLWQETDPSAATAPRVLSSLLLRGGKLDEARDEFMKVLKADPDHAATVFLQLYPLTASYPDKPAVLKMMRELAASYPVVAEAHWLVAQLAVAAGDEPLALQEVRKAKALRAEWDAPVELEAALLAKTEPLAGLDLLSHYLTKYPQADSIRLQYARALLAQKRYQLAHDEFKALSQRSPDNLELAFAVALISLQLNDMPGAEAELRRATAIKGADAVEYFLGQLNEAKTDEAEALIHYRAVTSGEYQFPATLRLVYLLNKLGQLDAARLQLKLAQAVTPARQLQVLMIDAQLLSDAGQYSEAYQVLLQGLLKYPDQTELLYDAAMAADKLNQYAASEKLLRKLIQIKPDFAHAYNALGYSFLERNVHIKEAVTLVEKALALSPDDPAIMDSVGWGYYRSGRLDESVVMLKRSFSANADPEIAAHLGEVLWVRGDKTEATRIWQDSLKAHPDNAPLLTVIKRYQP